MPNAAFHHTSLTVSDLKRSLDFYENVVGMTKLYESRKQGGHLEKVVGLPGADVLMSQLAFGGTGHRLELFQYLSPAPAEAVTLNPNMVGITHICFIVEDMPSTYERLSANGANFFSAPILLEDGANAGGYSVYLRDPDGIIIELLKRPDSKDNAPAQ